MWYLFFFFSSFHWSCLIRINYYCFQPKLKYIEYFKYNLEQGYFGRRKRKNDFFQIFKNKSNIDIITFRRIYIYIYRFIARDYDQHVWWLWRAMWKGRNFGDFLSFYQNLVIDLCLFCGKTWQKMFPFMTANETHDDFASYRPGSTIYDQSVNINVNLGKCFHIKNLD
jgi:hypothetical protein